MKMDFDDDQYIKTKIKIYAGSIITNFRNEETPPKKHYVNIYQ